MGIISFMLRFKYFIDRGFNYNIKAHKMLNVTNSNTLVIHGTNDSLVPFEKVSIYSKKDLIYNDKVEYLKMDDEMHNEHNSVIASTDCVLYQKEMQEIYDKSVKAGKTPQEARQIMINKIDVFKFNKANDELMNIIDDFYNKQK